MPDTVLPQPDPQALDRLLREQALALRAADGPPKDRAAWLRRKAELRQRIFAALGPLPEKACPLEPRVLGVLRRQGYVIERLVFQSRPDVWVTASVYVPDPVRGKLPAVLVVHGHWPWARRDPVVQARCLGLVRLGFPAATIEEYACALIKGATGVAGGGPHRDAPSN